jgi:hypothetical protein
MDEQFDDIDEMMKVFGAKLRARGAGDFLHELIEHFDGHFGRFLVVKQMAGDMTEDMQFGDMIHEN